MSKCLIFSPNYSLLYYTLLCEKSKHIFSLFIVADLMQQKSNTFILVLDVKLYLKKFKIFKKRFYYFQLIFVNTDSLIQSG